MRAWLKDQSAVAAVDVYCTSYMETGCNLHADVTLVSDTSAEDAAAVIDGALEKAVQDSRVTAGYFNIGLEWQYHSTQLRHQEVSVHPPDTNDDDLTPESRAGRLELISIATGLAGADAESIEVGLISIGLERGEVDTIPTNLLLGTPFSDNVKTTVLTDNFTLGAWRVRVISAPPDGQPPISAVNAAIDDVAQVPMPDGTKPLLELDTTEHDLIENPDPFIKVWFLPGDDDVLEARHAAPVLAAIDGTAYFAKAELRAEYGLYSSPSRVSYDMEDGRIRRGSGHPEEKARKVCDAAQRL